LEREEAKVESSKLLRGKGPKKESMDDSLAPFSSPLSWSPFEKIQLFFLRCWRGVVSAGKKEVLGMASLPSASFPAWTSQCQKLILLPLLRRRLAKWAP